MSLTIGHMPGNQRRPGKLRPPGRLSRRGPGSGSEETWRAARDATPWGRPPVRSSAAAGQCPGVLSLCAQKAGS